MAKNTPNANNEELLMSVSPETEPMADEINPYKPQIPLKDPKKDRYFYPLTSTSQVVDEKTNQRLDLSLAQKELKNWEIIIPASGWNGPGSYATSTGVTYQYSNEITVEEMKLAFTPIGTYWLVLPSDISQTEAAVEAINMTRGMDLYDGKVVVYASDKPTVDITVAFQTGGLISSEYLTKGEAMTKDIYDPNNHGYVDKSAVANAAKSVERYDPSSSAATLSEDEIMTLAPEGTAYLGPFYMSCDNTTESGSADAGAGAIKFYNSSYPMEAGGVPSSETPSAINEVPVDHALKSDNTDKINNKSLNFSLSGTTLNITYS